MGRIPQQIDSIITARRSRSTKIAAALEHIERVRQAVSSFELFRDAHREDDMLSPDVMSVSTELFNEQYRKAREALLGLKSRFERDGVHITFVGKAGHGKSRSLQRISGLSGSVIPSSAGTDCTGARSIITNTSSDTVIADISFFSEIEIVDHINKYIDKIYKGHMRRISSSRAIPSLDVKELESSMDRTNTTGNSLFEHLKEYIEHYDEYKDLIGRDPKSVPESDIEQYVAQFKYGDHSVRYWKYLAVKEANIRARFPFEQCGKIVLVDTIGLGPASLGIEEAMLKAAKEDSDVIIYMHKPGASRYTDSLGEHYSYISEIQDAVSHEYAREMLFWVVNKLEEGNEVNADGIPEVMSILRNNPATKDVAGIFAVNCDKKEAVETELLTPVLEHIESHLAELDEMLIDRVNIELKKLYDAYSALFISISKAKSSSMSADDKSNFRKDAKSLFNEWTGILRDEEVKGRISLIDTQNEEFRAEFEKAIKRMHILPSKENIVSLAKLGNFANVPLNLYNRLANHVRDHIIESFIKLDVPLEKIVKELKRSLLRVLVEDGAEENKRSRGRIGRVVGIDLEDPDKWLSRFIEILETSKIDCPNIILAAEELKDFSISAKGFLIFDVVASLKTLNVADNDHFRIPDLSTPPGLTPEQQYEHIAELILEHLRLAATESERHIRKNLDRYLILPNNAVYAAAQRFYDHITFSGTQLDQAGEFIEDQWIDMYIEFAASIWSDKFAALDSRKAISAEWNNISDELKAYSSDDLFAVRG